MTPAYGVPLGKPKATDEYTERHNLHAIRSYLLNPVCHDNDNHIDGEGLQFMLNRMARAYQLRYNRTHCKCTVSRQLLHTLIPPYCTPYGYGTVGISFLKFLTPPEKCTKGGGAPCRVYRAIGAKGPRTIPGAKVTGHGTLRDSGHKRQRFSRSTSMRGLLAVLPGE